MAVTAKSLRELADSLSKPDRNVTRPQIGSALNEAAAALEQAEKRPVTALDLLVRARDMTRTILAAIVKPRDHQAWERFFSAALTGFMSDPSITWSDVDDVKMVRRMVKNCAEIADESVEQWRARWINTTGGKPEQPKKGKTAAPVAPPPAEAPITNGTSTPAATSGTNGSQA